jgi:2,3-bisphosphoglycerate-independent phosphoglycerate mutase
MEMAMKYIVVLGDGMADLPLEDPVAYTELVCKLMK